MAILYLEMVAPITILLVYQVGEQQKNTTATILSNNQIVGEADADIRAGYRIWNNKNKYEEIEELYRQRVSQAIIQDKLNKLKRSDIWVVGNVGVAGSSFKLHYPTNAFNEQIKRQSYTSRQLNIGVNYWTSRLLGGTFLAGATIGVQYSDNFDDLDESIVEDTHLVIAPTSGTNRTITTKQTVYQGLYKKDLLTVPINFDIFYAPDRLGNLALLATGSTVCTDGGTTKTKVGIGFFILKDKNPTIPNGGIVLSYTTIFYADKTDDANGSKSKFGIALTTRINLLKRQR